jgi:hypothetical protein
MGDRLMRFPFIKPKPEPEPNAPAPTDVELIRTKLAETAAQIEAAEAELRRVSLNAALSDDPAAGFDAIGRLSELRTRQEILNAALAAALQAEADAQAAERLRDHQARRRAAAQHAARLEKTSKAITAALATLVAEYGKAAEAAQALVATLPPHMRTVEEPWHSILGPTELKRMVEIEAYRVAREQPGPALFDRVPGAGMLESRTDGYTLPSLGDRVGELCGSVKEHFDRATPAAPTMPTPQSTREPVPEMLAVVLDAGELLALPKEESEPIEEEEVVNG